MLTREELLQSPNYLLSSYQNDIYNLVVDYKEENKLSQKDLAKKWGVSESYISQILNGQFNFTLKKIVELGVITGKVPCLQFLDKEEYWRRMDHTKGGKLHPQQIVSVNIFTKNLLESGTVLKEANLDVRAHLRTSVKPLVSNSYDLSDNLS